MLYMVKFIGYFGLLLISIGTIPIFNLIFVTVWLNPGRHNPDGSKNQPAIAGLFPGGVKIQPGKN